MRFSISTIAIVLCLTLVGCLDYNIKDSTMSSNVVEVEVVSKKKESGLVSYMYIDDIPIPIINPDRHIVKFSDNSNVINVDNKNLYNMVEVGDFFEIDKIIYTNINGEIVKTNFKLKERFKLRKKVN